MAAIRDWELGYDTFSTQEAVDATVVFSDVPKKPIITKSLLVLKPFAKTSNNGTITFPPLSPESEPYLSRSLRAPIEVDFEGWTYAPRKWRQWKDKVSQKHSARWRKTRIHDAIESSMYHVPPRPNFVLELVKYWYPSSNTFVFPWGEATITLEDVWVLGGYSVLSQELSFILPVEMGQQFQQINEFQTMMSKRYPAKTEQVKWMDFFMEEETDHELEHIAFLSMWLSRFVFPFKDPFNAINKDVFATAVGLSQGSSISLASAVLAGVYHSMNLLKKKVFLKVYDDAWMSGGSIKLVGNFELVHLWALERFPALAPMPRVLERGQPRAARWHERDVDINCVNVNDHLKSDYNMIFVWRPYTSSVLRWSSHYTNKKRLVKYILGSDKDLSYAMSLCACMLTGVAGVPNQKYMPHRVPRQFGMDQHLPGNFADMSPNNINNINNFVFYVPAKNYQPSVSLDYIKWWKRSWGDYEKKLAEAKLAEAKVAEAKLAEAKLAEAKVAEDIENLLFSYFCSLESTMPMQ